MYNTLKGAKHWITQVMAKTKKLPYTIDTCRKQGRAIFCKADSKFGKGMQLLKKLKTNWDIKGAEVVQELCLVTIFLDNNRAVSNNKLLDRPESLLKSFHGIFYYLTESSID